MATKTGTSNISVKWTKYGLEAVISVTASVVIPRGSFSMTIEGLTADPDGGYGFIPSASTSELYHIALSDDLGTTESEWVSKYNNGELKFSLQSSWTSIVVSSNKLYLQKTTNGSTGILSRYVNATITDESSPSGMTANSGVQLPPFGSSFTLYNCSKLTSRTSCSTSGWNFLFKGATQYLKWVSSGTELTCAQIQKLYNLGILTACSGITTIIESNDVMKVDTSGDSTSTGSTYRITWNDGNSYSQELLLRTWMAYSGITRFGVCDTSSNTIIASNSTWLTTNENTYSGSVSSTNQFSYFLFISDPRLPASELLYVLQFTYADASSLGTNVGYQKAVGIDVYCNRSRHYSGNGDGLIYHSPTRSSRPSSITSTQYSRGNAYQYNSNLDVVIICTQSVTESTAFANYGSNFCSYTAKLAMSEDAWGGGSNNYDYIKICITGSSTSGSAYAGGEYRLFSYYIYIQDLMMFDGDALVPSSLDY